MSHRPIRSKQANRLRKAMRGTPKTVVDVVSWLKMHGYAQTTGEAEKIILAERVMDGSKVLGVKMGFILKPEAKIKQLLGQELDDEDYREDKIVQRLVDARWGDISVKA